LVHAEHGGHVLLRVPLRVFGSKLIRSLLMFASQRRRHLAVTTPRAHPCPLGEALLLLAG
jgi:hypothetical protein